MNRYIRIVISVFALVLFLIHTTEAKNMPANQMSIKNKYMRVDVDLAARSFSMTAGKKTVVVPSGEFPFLSGPLNVVSAGPARNKKYGAGSQITIKDAAGSSVALVLYSNIPFLFVATKIGTAESKTEKIKSVDVAKFPVALNTPRDRIRTQGTGFLSTPDKNPGSYVFMAVADKYTNRGLVTAWLTENRGSGVVLATEAGGKPTLTARVEYGNLHVSPRGPATGEKLLVGYFDDARLGLEQYADLVAKEYDIEIMPPMDGYCSWYSNPHGGANDETGLKIIAKESAELLQPYGLKFIQIDDMWQAGERRNGPAKNFYAHKKAIGPYPHGMKAAADNLLKYGFVPGIWWMPFAGDQRDPFFMKHDNWFVRTKDGTPYETEWGGTSLDMTNPEAMEYMKSVAAQLSYKWGYKYFKMDGLYTGIAVRQQYVNHEYKPDDIGEAVFYNQEMTNIEAFRAGLKAVREAAGEDVFFLGCTVAQNMRSFGASFGLVNAMRVGEDNGPAWDAQKTDLLAGPRAASNRYFLNGRVWWNDPDPVYIRSSIPIEHARTITSWVGLTGMMMTYSEWLPDMPAERIRILQRIIPNHGLKARPVDYFDSYIPRIWLLADKSHVASSRRYVLGLFNWDPSNYTDIQYNPVRAGLPKAKAYVGFDFWNNKFIAPFDNIYFRVPKGDCLILAIRPVAQHPQVISTNRHITQGIVDVTNEKWSGKVLSGTSEIVGGDPYELRVVTPIGRKAWVLKTVSTGDPGVETSFKQNGPYIRVTLKSKNSAMVKWSLSFGS